MKYNFLGCFYHEYLSLFSTIIKTISRNLKKEKFEPEVEALGKIIKPGQVCIDIGGAYGRYALPLSLATGAVGKVFSFEPGRYSYRVLRAVKWFHRLKNVSIYKLAISYKNGSINLCLPVKKTGKIGASLAFVSSAPSDNAVCESVQMTSVDEFCRVNKIDAVNFIKCDIEGAELPAFRGAAAIIKKCRPAILSEVDAGNMLRYGFKPVDLEEFFSGIGYKAFAYKGGALAPVVKITEDGNYFFLPG